MHVDDLGDAVVFILEKWSPSLKSEVHSNIFHLNVGTGKEITIKLAEFISKEIDRRKEPG